jgi:hypothetical protein
MKRIKTLLVAVGIAAATLLTTAPANAAPACDMSVNAELWGAGEILLRSCDAYAWTDWNSDGEADEIFAVRFDRTVWHAWPNSYGWALMPGNKTADDINNRKVDGKSATWWSGRTRNVSIWVAGGTGYWCTSDPGSGWTGRWRDC